MRNCKNYRLPNRRMALAALGLLLCGTAPIYAQTAGTDAVEELRQILKGSVNDLAVRDSKLQEQINLLHGISDLRRAVALREWRDEEGDVKVAGVDRRHRGAVVGRFEQDIREVLKHGDQTGRLAVISILGEMGATVRGVGMKGTLVSRLGPDLADLIQHADAATSVVAARILGQINPDPEAAVPVLRSLLGAKDSAPKLAAAEALLDLMRVVSRLAVGARNPTGVEASHAEVVRMGRAIVPAAAQGLQETDPEVRRRCIQAIGQAADALQRLVQGAHSLNETDWEAMRRQAAEERSELLPFILILKEQVPALTRKLADPDAEVRLLARRALEDMINPQLYLLERETTLSNDRLKTPPVLLQPSHFVLDPAAPKEPLLEGLQGTVLALAEGIKDPDLRARRAALDVLETLGSAAAPAALALVGALADADPFVRWAAARTLGRISPVEAELAVPGLARLLEDGDLDLRLAAAVALERYGPSAKTAIPQLIKAAQSTDAELRVATIRTLGAIGGPQAQVAIPVITQAVADPDARVRETAAGVLGAFGPVARDAIDALRKALQDQKPEVQKAAGEALLKIVQLPKK